MDTSRGFLFITYKLYHHLNKLEGEHKSHCLNDDTIYKLSEENP